jgi:hypothetical protein
LSFISALLSMNPRPTRFQTRFQNLKINWVTLGDANWVTEFWNRVFGGARDINWVTLGDINWVATGLHLTIYPKPIAPRRPGARTAPVQRRSESRKIFPENFFWDFSFRVDDLKIMGRPVRAANKRGEAGGRSPRTERKTDNPFRINTTSRS